MDSKPTVDAKHRDALEAFARLAGFAPAGPGRGRGDGRAWRCRPHAARRGAPRGAEPVFGCHQRRAADAAADSRFGAGRGRRRQRARPEAGGAQRRLGGRRSSSRTRRIFSGPKWEELTGIKVNPIGKPFPELFAAQVAEHLGATGAYDVLSFVPAWTADFVAQGMPEPLDPYIDAVHEPRRPRRLSPALQGPDEATAAKRYGLFDDGDTIILYYRTDLFSDPANMDAFKAQYGPDLAAPKDWTEYDADPVVLHRKGRRQ